MHPASLREVSRRGGLKTAQLYDMAKIGRSGGMVTAGRGSRHFAQIGRLGGQASSGRLKAAGDSGLARSARIGLTLAVLPARGTS